MFNLKKRTKLSKKQIKNSSLNDVKLDDLEKTYSTGKNLSKPQLLLKRNTAFVAGTSTILVFFMTFGSLYSLYAMTFGSEDRLAIIGLDNPSIVPFVEDNTAPETVTDNGNTDTSNNTSVEQNPNTNQTNQTPNNQNMSSPPPLTPNDNKFCSIGSEIPDQVCQAILSIQDDKTISNKFITANVVKQIEQMPTGSTIKILENTWVSETPTTGTMSAEVYAGAWGDFLVEGTLEFSNNQWTVTDVYIAGSL